VEFLKKIWRNDYLRNLIYAICGIAVLVALTMVFLKLYTRHGQSQPVPDFKGLTLNEVYKIADAQSLRIEVTDSIFRQTLEPGSVIEQNPKPNSLVKKNRKIFLVINCLIPKKVETPNIVGFSLRQGKAVLESKGLKVGKISYRPDIATNNILEQRYKGLNMLPNEKVIINTEIDLVLGYNNNFPEYTSIPSVLRQNANAAHSNLINASLNCGRKYYDSSVKTAEDSLSALVYRQNPAAKSAVDTPLGATVDIYLTTDQTKIPK
jgi:beta-lactam-binding protein with PASTA domain